MRIRPKRLTEMALKPGYTGRRVQQRTSAAPSGYAGLGRTNRWAAPATTLKPPREKADPAARSRSSAGRLALPHCRYSGGKRRNALSMASLIARALRCGLELSALVATLRQIMAFSEASHTSITSVPRVTVLGRVVDEFTPNPIPLLFRREPLQVFTPEYVV